MPTLTPQPRRQKILIMQLKLLRRHPCTLLAIGDDFERQTSCEKGEPENV